MAPHRALYVPELLRLVFGELLQPDLARCARTCYLFSNPALDALWRNLDLRGQLLAIVPPACHDQHDGLFRIVDEVEWSRFDKYARRVRTFTPWSPNASQLYFLLLKLRPRVAPFPNLHTLTLPHQPDEPESLRFPDTLLRMNIGYLSNVVDQWRKAHVILQIAAQQVPKLQHMTVGSITDMSQLMHISELKHLRFLDIRGVTNTSTSLVVREFISALAELAWLVELLLPLRGIFGENVSHHRGFTRLEVLSIHALPTTVIKFLQNLRTRNLRKITMTCHYGGSATTFEWREVVQHLCSTFRASLVSVGIFGAIADGGSPAIRTLEPLLGLRQLESLEVRYTGASSTVTDIQTMALAWPNLTKFTFEAMTRNASQVLHSGSSLQSLIYIAQHCPKLRILRIFIDDTRKIPDYSQWQPMSHGLRELVLGCANIRDTLRLARFLDRIFPVVDEINVYADAEAEGYDERGLEDLPRIMKMFQGVRGEHSAVAI